MNSNKTAAEAEVSHMEHTYMKKYKYLLPQKI